MRGEEPRTRNRDYVSRPEEPARPERPEPRGRRGRGFVRDLEGPLREGEGGLDPLLAPVEGDDVAVLADRDVLPDGGRPGREGLLRVLVQAVDDLAGLGLGRRAHLAARDVDVEDDLRRLRLLELPARAAHRDGGLGHVEGRLAVLLADVERDRREGAVLADRLFPGPLDEGEERVRSLRQGREDPRLVGLEPVRQGPTVEDELDVLALAGRLVLERLEVLDRDLHLDARPLRRGLAFDRGGPRDRSRRPWARRSSRSRAPSARVRPGSRESATSDRPGSGPRAAAWRGGRKRGVRRYGFICWLLGGWTFVPSRPGEAGNVAEEPVAA